MNALERLEERKWQLANSFGRGSFRDGLVRQQIEQLDEEIAAARAVAEKQGAE